MSEDGDLRAIIDVSPKSGAPCISLFDVNMPQGISLTVGRDGHAAIGIAGKDVLIVGLSAFADGRRAVFVLDDKGREVFVAGIDMNGEHFIKLSAADGSTIWEARRENKEEEKTGKEGNKGDA